MSLLQPQLQFVPDELTYLYPEFMPTQKSVFMIFLVLLMMHAFACFLELDTIIIWIFPFKNLF